MTHQLTNKMTTSEYVTCTTCMGGITEVVAGLYRASDTLTFTKDEWEVFRSAVEDAFADFG